MDKSTNLTVPVKLLSELKSTLAQSRHDSMLQPFCIVWSYRQLLAFSRCRWSENWTSSCM